MILTNPEGGTCLVSAPGLRDMFGQAREKQVSIISFISYTYIYIMAEAADAVSR